MQSHEWHLHSLSKAPPRPQAPLPPAHLSMPVAHCRAPPPAIVQVHRGHVSWQLGARSRRHLRVRVGPSASEDAARRPVPVSTGGRDRRHALQPPPCPRRCRQAATQRHLTFSALHQPQPQACAHTADAACQRGCSAPPRPRQHGRPRPASCAAATALPAPMQASCHTKTPHILCTAPAPASGLCPHSRRGLPARMQRAAPSPSARAAATGVMRCSHRPARADAGKLPHKDTSHSLHCTSPSLRLVPTQPTRPASEDAARRPVPVSTARRGLAQHRPSFRRLFARRSRFFGTCNRSQRRLHAPRRRCLQPICPCLSHTVARRRQQSCKCIADTFRGNWARGHAATFVSAWALPPARMQRAAPSPSARAAATGVMRCSHRPARTDAGKLPHKDTSHSLHCTSPSLRLVPTQPTRPASEDAARRPIPVSTGGHDRRHALQPPPCPHRCRQAATQRHLTFSALHQPQPQACAHTADAACQRGCSAPPRPRQHGAPGAGAAQAVLPSPFRAPQSLFWHLQSLSKAPPRPQAPLPPAHLSMPVAHCRAPPPAVLQMHRRHVSWQLGARSRRHLRVRVGPSASEDAARRPVPVSTGGRDRRHALQPPPCPHRCRQAATQRHLTFSALHQPQPQACAHTADAACQRGCSAPPRPRQHGWQRDLCTLAAAAISQRFTPLLQPKI